MDIGKWLKPEQLTEVNVPFSISKEDMIEKVIREDKEARLTPEKIREFFEILAVLLQEQPDGAVNVETETGLLRMAVKMVRPPDDDEEQVVFVFSPEYLHPENFLDDE